MKKAGQVLPCPACFLSPVAVFVTVFHDEIFMEKKVKNHRTFVALGFQLELLARFELATSSLPSGFGTFF